MPRFLILLLHNLLYPPALLLMAPGALRKMRARGGRWSDLRQRLGFFDEDARGKIAALRRRGRVWWMHAVSVGEVGVASRLVRELLGREGAPGIVLSTTTPTGLAEARKLAAEHPERVCVIYNPLDLWFTVRRCLGLIRPERLVLVEAEVWPNLVHAARRRRVRVSLVNARLSPKSERRYGRVLPLVRPVFAMLSDVFVQEPEDVARWERLGVDPGRIACVGSVKYDTAGQAEPRDQVVFLRRLLERIGWDDGRPILLGASTHAGEEAALAAMLTGLRGAIPGLRLLLVPRHAERAATIERELAGLKLAIRRRSELDGAAGPISRSAAPDIFLVDSTGELRAWQHLATAVVVGKSFLGVGGQNPAEAVTAGRPVFFGPHMENFAPLVRQLLAAGGAVQVGSFAELGEALRRVLPDGAETARMVAAAGKALRAHEGATARTATGLLA